MLLFVALLGTGSCRSREAGLGDGGTGVAGGSECERARVLRATAEGLVREGRLDRAVRTVDEADGQCPGERGRSRALLLQALGELGDAERVRALAAEVEAAPSSSEAERSAAREAVRAIEVAGPTLPETEEARKPMRRRMAEAEQAFRAGQWEQARAAYLEAWTLWHPQPEALAMAGRCSVQMGQRPEGQRLLDRALREALRLGGPLVVEDQHSMQGGTRVAWSRDGRWIAVGHGAVITLLDGASYLQRGPQLRGHSDKINAIDVSPDGQVVASGAADGSVRVWETDGGKPLRKLPANWATVHAVAFSPDGRTLAADSNNVVRLWDAHLPRVRDTLKGLNDAVNAMAFSPDGRMVAVGSYDNMIGLWEVGSARVIRKLYREGLPGRSMGFSIDGKLLAANTGRTILLWDTAQGKVAREFGEHEPAAHLAFQPSGELLASAATGASSDKVVRLWDWKTGQLVRELKGLAADPTSLAFRPDGQVLACGAEDRTVTFWDVATGRVVHSIHRPAQRISSVSFGPEGRSIAAVANTDRVVVFELQEGGAAMAAPVKATHGSFRAEDGLLVTADHKDRSVRLLDAGGKVTREIAATGAAGGGVVAFSPDGKKAAVGSASGALTLIDLGTGAAAAQVTETDRAHALCFSPDGTKVVIGGGYHDRAVRVWDPQTGEVTRKVPSHQDRTTAIAFSADGHLLATGSEDRTLQLWDLRHPGPGRSVHTGGAPVTSIAISPDGSHLAEASEEPVIRVWNAAAGKLVRELHGHEAPVRSVAYSPDGKWLASGSDDGSVRLWEAAGGKELATMRVAGAEAWYVLARAAEGQVRVGGASAAEAEAYLQCRFGTLLFAFELCRERVTGGPSPGEMLRRAALQP